MSREWEKRKPSFCPVSAKKTATFVNAIVFAYVSCCETRGTQMRTPGTDDPMDFFLQEYGPEGRGHDLGLTLMDDGVHRDSDATQSALRVLAVGDIGMLLNGHSAV
jgi:hypothetical protein